MPENQSVDTSIQLGFWSITQAVFPSGAHSLHTPSALTSRWNRSQPVPVTLPAAAKRSGASPVGKGNGRREARYDSRCHHVTLVATENTKEVLSQMLMLETSWSSHPCARDGEGSLG